MSARPGRAPRMEPSWIPPVPRRKARTLTVREGIDERPTHVILVSPDGSLGSRPIAEHLATLHGWELWCALVATAPSHEGEAYRESLRAMLDTGSADSLTRPCV